MFAPGLVPNPGYSYPEAFQRIGLQPIGGPVPSAFNLSAPGTIPTLQGLVRRVFDALPSNEMASTFRAPAGNKLEISGLAADDQGNSDDDKVVSPRKNRPLLKVLKLNPLDLGAKKETNDAVGTSGKHRFGTPVRDAINKVLGHDDEKDNESVGEKTETG